MSLPRSASSIQSGAPGASAEPGAGGRPIKLIFCPDFLCKCWCKSHVGGLSDHLCTTTRQCCITKHVHVSGEVCLANRASAQGSAVAAEQQRQATIGSLLANPLGRRLDLKDPDGPRMGLPGSLDYHFHMQVKLTAECGACRAS